MAEEQRHFCDDHTWCKEKISATCRKVADVDKRQDKMISTGLFTWTIGIIILCILALAGYVATAKDMSHENKAVLSEFRATISGLKDGQERIEREITSIGRILRKNND